MATKKILTDINITGTGTFSGVVSSGINASTANHLVRFGQLSIANWNSAFTHSELITGNPHNIAYGDLGGTLPAHIHAISDVTNLQTELNAKEDAFSKFTGFNKNFGTTVGTVSQGNHTHPGMGDVSGPGSAVNNNIAVFDNTTGKLIKDGGATIASLATTASLANYQLTSEKGAASGYAPLNSSTKIDPSYLPSYVDEVQEYANLAAFPATGLAGVIYVALDTNKTYRWSGTGYTEISASLVLGTTTGTAFDGGTGHGHVTDGDIHVTATQKTNWNTAYGWGDHDGIYLPLLGGALSGANPEISSPDGSQAIVFNNNYLRVNLNSGASGNITYTSTSDRVTMNVDHNVFSTSSEVEFYNTLTKFDKLLEAPGFKFPGATAGHYLKADGTTGLPPSGTGTVTSITASSPLTGGVITTSGSIGINKASGTIDGYLDNVDWTTFNNKVSGGIADNQVAFGNGTSIAGSNNFTWDGTRLDIKTSTNESSLYVTNTYTVPLNGAAMMSRLRNNGVKSHYLDQGIWRAPSYFGLDEEFITLRAHEATNGTHYLFVGRNTSSASIINSRLQLGYGLNVPNLSDTDVLSVNGTGKFVADVTATTFKSSGAATNPTYLLQKDGIYVPASSGGIGGSIADDQVAFGNGTNIAGSNNFKWSGTKLSIIGEGEFSSNLTAFKVFESSDSRLKENIVHLDDTFVTFNFKKDEKKIKHYGTIAQELEVDFPELVKDGADGFKSVDYTGLLVKELVKVKKKNIELEERLERLETIVFQKM